MNLYTYDYLEKNGRLGNQLWQIAATICRAEENEGCASFRPDWEYRPYFSVPDYYFAAPEDQEDWDNVIDGGTEYFQDYANFEPIEDLIRLYFKPSYLAVEQTRKVVVPDDPFCAIHVRRGDYLKNPKHFPITTQKFYSASVREVCERNPDISFMVFSDDPDWCENNPQHFGFTDHHNVIWHHGVVRPVEIVDRKGAPQDQWDFFAMSQADEHIISNSTFAWWAAYLSQSSKVYYPNKWFGPAVPNWETALNCIPDDPRWVMLPC